jgi:hypothetical protein
VAVGKVMEIKICKPEELEKINDLLHDCWFDIDKISVDNNTFKLNFTCCLETRKRILKNYLFIKQFEIPEVEGILEIHEVKSYEIIDTEKVKNYDINELVFNPEINSISILTGIPLTIRIDVLSLKVSVAITDEIISTKKVWNF